MEYTGERVIPGKIELNDLYVEHMSRYLFASKYVKDKSVLDSGCGCGYGSYTLAVNGACEVVGIDISKDAVEYSKNHYGRSNLEYLVMDCRHLKFPDSRFDVVVSFEFIEHIKEQDDYLTEICRVLKDNGVLIISTPNKKYGNPSNEFHIKEFHLPEFRDFLKKYFREIDMFNQNYSLSYLNNKQNFEDIQQSQQQLQSEIQQLRSEIDRVPLNILKMIIPEFIRGIFPQGFRNRYKNSVMSKFRGINNLCNGTSVPDNGVLYDEASQLRVKPCVAGLGDMVVGIDDIEDALYFIAVCSKPWL
ncbi:MAG: class I SAM-dependent methyltransferase [Candidatus Altiarchaeota archaeon]|nr:class I SAM-dependent methyltransferase [Candidatus Altiarchaeota archaeon]